MNMTISFDGKDLKADCSALIKSMRTMQEKTGRSQAECVRRGTIELLKSLRKRTAQADKRVPKKDVRPYTGDGPHYITPKGKNQKSQHRFTVVRRAPSPDSYGFAYPANSEAQARRQHGKIAKWGLAKKSWGHAMAALFNRADAKGGNPKAQLKSGLVEGHMRDIVTGDNPRVEVEIVNKLGYITEATPAHVVDEAIRAATKSMEQMTEDAVRKAQERAGL